MRTTIKGSGRPSHVYRRAIEAYGGCDGCEAGRPQRAEPVASKGDHRAPTHSSRKVRRRPRTAHKGGY